MTPAFQIVRGAPDHAELAALTAVLMIALARGPRAEPRPPRSPTWAVTAYQAPGSWQASGRRPW